MYCSKCGHELSPGSNFCPVCGKEMKNTGTSVTVTGYKQKKRSRLVWPVLLASACVIVGIGAFLYNFMGNARKEQWVTTVKEDGKWYVINGKNEKLAEIALDDILYVSGFNEYGVAVVEVGQEENPDITYMNTDGEILTSLFESFTGYDAGAYRPIQSGDNWCCGRGIFEENGKFGFIDATGEVKVSPVYDEVYGFGKNGLAAVEAGDLWGYVDTEGEMVIEPSYFLAEPFSDNGLALVITQDGEQCFIDGNGETIIDTGYNAFTSDYIVYSFDDNGFARVKLDGIWGVMNEKGKMIAEPIYDWVYSCGEDSIRVCLESGYGVMDGQGTMCITPVYELILPLNEKFYAVLMGDLWGAVNQNGEEIVEPAYNYIGTLGKKKWIGYSDDDTKVCLLNHDGTIAETWESNEDFWHTHVYNRELDEEELFGVKTSGTWNFVDDEDRIRFKTEEEIESIDPTINFTGSPIAVRNDDNWGYIDSNGKLMIDFQYERANPFFDKGSLDL